MSIKVTLSYTHEDERKYVMGLLKPILEAGGGYKVLDGSDYSHVYIPRKGSINLQNVLKKKQNTL